MITDAALEDCAGWAETAGESSSESLKVKSTTTAFLGGEEDDEDDSFTAGLASSSIISENKV